PSDLIARDLSNAIARDNCLRLGNIWSFEPAGSGARGAHVGAIKARLRSRPGSTLSAPLAEASIGRRRRIRGAGPARADEVWKGARARVAIGVLIGAAGNGIDDSAVHPARGARAGAPESRSPSRARARVVAPRGLTG